MTKSHTQERLIVANDGTVGSIQTESGTPIGHTFQVKTMKEDLLQIERRENARRFVACWNACIDLPTESLERSDILAAGIAKRDAQAAEIEALKEKVRYDGFTAFLAVVKERDALKADAERLGQAILQLQTILNQRLNATQMLQAESEARDWLESIGSEPR